MIESILTLTILTLSLLTLCVLINIGLILAERTGKLLKGWGFDVIQLRAAWVTHRADEARLGLDLEREQDKLEFSRQQARLQIAQQRLALESGQSNEGP